MFQCLGLTPEELERRQVDFIDIAYDDVKPHHYKESEDPKFFKSKTTNRGPLVEGWRDSHVPIMTCYKAVHVKFEVWGLQTKVEEYTQGVGANLVVSKLLYYKNILMSLIFCRLFGISYCLDTVRHLRGWTTGTT